MALWKNKAQFGHPHTHLSHSVWYQSALPQACNQCLSWYFCHAKMEIREGEYCSSGWSSVQQLH